MTSNPNPTVIWKESLAWWASVLGLGVMVVFAFFGGLKELVRIWGTHEEYSYGYMIPVITAFLIWQRKDQLEGTAFSGSWAGVVLMGVGLGVFGLGFIQFLHKYLKLGISIGGIIAITLLIIITVLVFNTIRLTIHARRNIIQIMKLVGATNQFIKGPFIYEGILQGLIGGLLSVILLWTIHYAVKYFMFAELAMENYISGLVVLGILLGLIGSYVSVNKYLD